MIVVNFGLHVARGLEQRHEAAASSEYKEFRYCSKYAGASMAMADPTKVRSDLPSWEKLSESGSQIASEAGKHTQRHLICQGSSGGVSCNPGN